MRLPVLLLLLLPIPALAGDVPLLVYRDANGSSKSDLEQKVAGADEPLPDVLVRLLGAGGPLEELTGADGVATFPDVSDGVWLLAPDLPDAVKSSHNIAPHLTALVEAGADSLVYVALGDSTPVVGSGKPYPKRVAALLDPLIPVDLHNLAEPGSTSVDWLPGVGADWGNAAVQSWLAKADLITLTIGGNDLQDAAYSGDVQQALALIDQALENIAVIAAGIREINPAADLVVTVYPNYSLASEWEQYIPADFIAIVRTALDSKLQEMRAKIGAVEGVIVADCYKAFQAGEMDSFMYDAIHVNDAGHELYAQTIFRAVGGVRLPEEDGVVRMVGLLLDETPVQPGEDAGSTGDAGGAGDAGVAGDSGTGTGADDVAGSDPKGGDATGGALDSASSPDASAPGDDALESTADASGQGASADGGCAAVPSPASAPWFALLALVALVWRRRRA